MKFLLLLSFFWITSIQAFESQVEKIFLDRSKHAFRYEAENFPIIEVQTPYELGKLTALRLIEQIAKNPSSVIALPTGKTPEFFIKYLSYYKEHWHEPKVQEELKNVGLSSPSFPDTSQLRFVMLDEIFPLPKTHVHSFTNYVKKYYLSILDIPPENLLLMDLSSFDFPGEEVDLSLLEREAKNDLEQQQKQILLQVKKALDAYEKQIQDFGGIDFFVGGIGADGHISFNQKGSDKNSRTRLVSFNYPTAAALATDMGGIEHVRHRAAGTIGLGTITFNPNATIIIMASGEGKAKAIKEAMLQVDDSIPSSALIGHAGARFYLTSGAIKELPMRTYDNLSYDEIIIDRALSLKQTIEKTGSHEILRGQVKERLLKKMRNSLFPPGQTILHTAPHHDDIMLSFYPLAKRLIENHQNYFVYLTSGFNAVTDTYLLEKVDWVLSQMGEIEDYDTLLSQFKNAYDHHQISKIAEIENKLIARHIHSPQEIKEWLSNKFPGEKDPEEIQQTKGHIRESEVDRLWALSEVSQDHIHHLRSKFYNGEYFNPLPKIEEDALPLYKLIEKHCPTLISVTMDPQSTGPDTHYKVLQIVAEALRMTPDDYQPIIWGYRNIWHRFSPFEATLMVPVSEDELQDLNDKFLTCFSTQKSASFPSHELDGPFSQLSEKILREQKQILEILLGDDLPDFIKKASGVIFIKEMTKEEFLKQTEKLKHQVE